MQLSKITHRRELRIRVDFAYNAEATARLKQIPDARWSQSLKCWHVPYTKEVFEQLKELFPEVEYEKSNPSAKSIIDNTTKNNVASKTLTEASIQNEQLTVIKTPKTNLVLKKAEHNNAIAKIIETNPTTTTKSVEIRITVTKKRLFVQLPKNDTDTQFLASFRYVHWNNTNKQWIVPNYGKNFELIRVCLKTAN